MSFILDALRKSETERQRQATPSLADAQYQVNKKKRGIWVPALVAILAANLLIIGYMLFDDSRDAGHTSQPADESASGVVERPLTIPAEEFSGDRTIAVETPMEEPVIAAPAEPATKIVAAAEPVTDSASSGMSPALAFLPSMQQLTLSGQLSLSPLHLDIHVYAGQVEKRFIFINMNKYREGDRLEEGPTVEEITTTGVILLHQGNRFTLERE